jgi:hypothetical protein
MFFSGAAHYTLWYNPCMDTLYDVAISFLSCDEPLALQLHDALCENLKVFVYSKQQEQLAGTDGLESFRQAFLSQSRLLVVLYRDGWGKTRWTAIEELAIKERMFNGGWKSLLFVMLDKQSTPPAWLPSTQLYLNHTDFGSDLLGAIKYRALELGSKLTPETAIEKAKRMHSKEAARRHRESKLACLDLDTVFAEWQTLCRLLDEKLPQIQQAHPSASFEYSSASNVYVIRTRGAGVVLQLRCESPTYGSTILIRLLVGRVILPKDPGLRVHIPGNEPDCTEEHEFSIDYNETFGWCWRPKDSEDSDEQLLQVADLSEQVLKQVVELHEQVQAGKITRRVRTSSIPLPRRHRRGTVWS